MSIVRNVLKFWQAAPHLYDEGLEMAKLFFEICQLCKMWSDQWVCDRFLDRCVNGLWLATISQWVLEFSRCIAHRVGYSLWGLLIRAGIKMAAQEVNLRKLHVTHAYRPTCWYRKRGNIIFGSMASHYLCRVKSRNNLRNLRKKE